MADGFGYKTIYSCTTEVHANLPLMKVDLDGYMYEIPRESFYQKSGSTCKPAIYAYKEDRIVLGSPFLNSYYQIYDMSRNQMALVPSIYMNNADSMSIKVPTYTEDWIKITFICMLVSGTILSSVLRFVQSLYEKIRPSDREREYRPLLL